VFLSRSGWLGRAGSNQAPKNNKKNKNMSEQNVEKRKLLEAKSLKLRAETARSHPYVVGRNYFIRTVTFYFTGRLVAVYKGEIVIDKAAWIPSCGRFTQFLLHGQPNECEPFPEAAQVIIMRVSVTDCVPWVHELPRTQK
jgi:hypothetical protein